MCEPSEPRIGLDKSYADGLRVMNSVIVVAGPSGSGKSVVARILARTNINFEIFELSRGIPQLLPSSPLSFEGRLSHLSKVYSDSSGRVEVLSRSV